LGGQLTKLAFVVARELANAPEAPAIGNIGIRSRDKLQRTSLTVKYEAIEIFLGAAQEKSVSLTCHDMLVYQIGLCLYPTKENHHASNTVEGQE